MNPGRLFLIPTPISDNQPDLIINTQTKKIICGLKWFLCENIRTARRFISALQLGLDIGGLEFAELSKDTPANDIADFIARIQGGEGAGVMSEAGCPGIADPGARIVALAHQREIEVVPLAGPSSIFMALMSSGFSGQAFVFHGYLPIDKNAAKAKLQYMEREANSSGATQIFMETPYRNNQLLGTILSVCRPSTHLGIAADLTGAGEFVKTKSVSAWLKAKPDLHKKPCIFLMGKL